MDRNITIREAARCLRKSDDFVRKGLQTGRLPIGYAVPGTGSRWDYFINPEQLRAVVGSARFSACFGGCT